MNTYVIELVTFKTKVEVAESSFIELFNNLNQVLKRDVTGFVKRTIYKDTEQDTWVEMIWWDSMISAQAALNIIPEICEFHRYCEALQEEGITMLHLEERA